MSNTVYKYRIRCTTDTTDEYVWNITEPTVCPTNSGHTIDGNLTTIVDTVEHNVVEIQEVLTPVNQSSVNGKIRIKGYEINVPESTDGTLNISFPYPIALMNGWFYSPSNSAGDILNLCAAPNTIIGTIDQATSNSMSEISVVQSVIDNVSVGHRLNLLDSKTFVINDLGEIQSIDTVAGNITVETATANIFNDFANTYVRLTVPIIEGMKISHNDKKYAFGKKKIGGMYLPKNTVLHVDYTNNEGNAKAFDFNMEYLY